jgi:hypothetical protein
MLAVCDNAPEVPTKLTRTGDAVAGASAAAVNVIVAGFAGVTEIVEGDTVTPVGRPLTATAMVPLKPLIAALFNVTCAVAPGAIVTVAGDAVRVKSVVTGGATAVTVNATGMFALNVPDAPFTLTVVVPTAASDAAVSVNVVLEPVATVAFAGAIVTPVGSPVMET